MENQYIKQYPDLMAGKKIMYVHGFGSSAKTGTVKRIQDTLPGATVVARDLPIHPEEAMELLRKMCEEEKPDLIIGTSMGGMYAEMLYGYDRILVNPAFQMGDTMHDHNMMGKQVFQNPREDGIQEFIVTKALVKEYKDMTEKCFAAITPEEQQHVGDHSATRTPWYILSTCSAATTRRRRISMANTAWPTVSFLHGVVPVIRWIDDRQEAASARSSISASTRWPAETRQVTSLQSTTACPDRAWTKHWNISSNTIRCISWRQRPPMNTSLWPRCRIGWRNMSTPAHDRIIFTNRKGLLYGDFFIDPNPSKSFMGTGIEYGSDEFKTWEEVLVYFKRLGGV